MATAEQYRAAASRLRSAADFARDAQFRGRTASYSVRVVGGSLEPVVDRALMAAQVMSADLEAACVSAEQECLARAVTCDAYAADYRQWQATHARWADAEYASRVSDGTLQHPGPAPSAPVKPAPWAELP